MRELRRRLGAQVRVHASGPEGRRVCGTLVAVTEHTLEVEPSEFVQGEAILVVVPWHAILGVDVLELPEPSSSFGQGVETAEARRSHPLGEIITDLSEHGMSADMISRWLDTPQAGLESSIDPAVTPAQVITAGRGDEVVALVAQMVASGSTPGPWTTCEVCLAPARWVRTVGHGDVEIVCEVHRHERDERAADPWQPLVGYDGESGSG